MKNSPMIGNRVFPTISAKELVEEYGISQTGVHFTHKKFGKVSVCPCYHCESKLALGKINEDDPNSMTLKVVAVVTFED